MGYVLVIYICLSGAQCGFLREIPVYDGPTCLDLLKAARVPTENVVMYCSPKQEPGK